MAQSLFDHAKELMTQGRLAEACPKLEESQRLDPKSGTLINLAACYEQAGRLASAWTKYLEAATAAKVAGNPEREAVARDRARALAPRVSKLVLVVAPGLKGLAGLQITRDGVIVGEPGWGVALPSDSGEHHVVAKAPGHEPFEAKVTVEGEGKTATVVVPELVALPPAPGTPGTRDARGTEPTRSTARRGLGGARIAALIAGSVGVVGVGVGTAFGLASKAKHDEAEQYCTGAACTDPRGVTAGDAAQTNGNISTAFMVVGGIGLASAVTLWLTAPPRTSESPSAQLGLGVGTLQMKGAF